MEKLRPPRVRRRLAVLAGLHGVDLGLRGTQSKGEPLSKSRQAGPPERGVEAFRFGGKVGVMALRYLTIDFNSFYASVEQQERPELRGKPVGVVPVMAETTGLVAVSLEARAAGLKRGGRVADARRLCPGIEIVEARPEVYIDYHRKLKDLIASLVPEIEVQSIDEVTVCLDSMLSRDEAEKLALKIKAAISREVGPCLRSSIGVAPTWLLAKVASDMQKPDGLVILDDEDVPGKLLHLAPGDIAGIGSNIQRRLAGHGITTMARLYAPRWPSFAVSGVACAASRSGVCSMARIFPTSNRRRGRASDTGMCCLRPNAIMPTHSPSCTVCCKRPRCACAIPGSMRAR